MVHHLLSYNYHWNLRETLFKTHITIEHLVKVEIHSPGSCSAGFGRINVFWLQTGTKQTSRSWIPSSGSIDSTLSARKLNLPLTELACTVENQGSSSSKLSKQMLRMMIVVECNKNHEDWLRFEEETWIWRFVFLRENLRIWRVLRSNLGNCVFCYD